MDRIVKIAWFNVLLLLLSGASLMAQEPDSVLTLSLQDAQEYAIQHNKMVKSSRYDVQAAEMSKWEVISNGLPRVDGSGSLNDNLKLMTTLLPGEIIGQPGTKVPVQFGSKYNGSYGFQATQMIFNAPYFVGVQTAKLAEKMSRQSLEKSEIDIREQVINTYFLILISRESLDILEENTDNLRDIYRSTKSMASVGMAEETDVDQMLSNVRGLETNVRSLERNLELNYNLLRFQLGLDMQKDISLTTDLDHLLAEANIEALIDNDFNYRNHIDFKLVQSQEKMQELTLKNEKASILPSLSTFYSWNKNGMGDELNGLDWFPNSMLGFQVNVPIFASGQRYSKIKKAQINLEKARTSKNLVSDQLLLQEKQLRFNLINSRDQFETQQENVEVAKRVYKSVENKYRQGMASSLDLTQAHNNYLQAENNYISAVMDLLQTKLALDKLLNNI
ncbi:MAG TPA: TolC family protein [Bacteroidales bacterium]|nr:TolC family protein [Bacteroidales bacterium]